jgi:hypothetical protein
MNAPPPGSAVARDPAWLEQEPVVIFLSSFGRPLYLWQCLDALWRQTHFPARVILLDNAHPSAVVGDVIKAFDRRGLFSEMVGFQPTVFQISRSLINSTCLAWVPCMCLWRVMLLSRSALAVGLLRWGES